MVYIDVEEYVKSETKKSIFFLRTIREASSMGLADVHTKYDKQFASAEQSGYEALERSLSPHPGLLRMMVVDDGQSDLRFPLLCSLPVEVPEDAISFACSLAMSNTNWLSELKEAIAMGWKVAARQQVFQGWFAKHERACIYAVIHTMNPSTHPGCIGRYLLSLW